jgi:dTDP-6-deoxy-L-talose 4-dehydrogenase (NAD+)
MRRGHEVIAVGRHPTPLLDLKGAGTWHGFELADTRKARVLLSETRPEGMIHLAWYANPADYLTSHENIRALAMTTNLVESALAAGCRRMVLTGSCVEYAATEQLRIETHPTEARTLYAACKESAWNLSRVLCDEVGAVCAWARIFHIHGPGEDPQRLVPWVARQIRAGLRVPLTDGTQVRDHLHVSDVAAGLVTLLDSGLPGATNICSGQPVTLRAVLEAVGDTLGDRGLLDFGARPHRSNETMFLAGDPARLRSLGWKPRFGLRDGLADALREYS